MAKSLNPIPGNDTIPKKPAGRSVAYPAFTINSSRDFTQVIYSHFGGNSFNTRETIAKILKKSPEVMKAPISSCVQYGLLEMRSSVGYKPTQRFMDLYKQDDASIYRAAMIACLKEPELYTNLLDAYKGDIIPTMPVLANALFKRHKILENVSEKVATIFLQNLEDLDLISADRKLLDPDAALEEFPISRPDDSNQEQDAPVKNAIDNDEEKPSHGKQKQVVEIDPELFVIEVPLINNRKAKILCPMDYTTRDLKKIIKVLDAYIDEDESAES